MLGNKKLVQVVRDKFKHLKMPKRGVYAVLVGCVLINLLFTLDQPSYLFNSSSPKFTITIVNVAVGFALLFFPLIGLLADVHFTRYRMIKASFVILSTTCIFIFLVETIGYFVFDVILQKRISIYATPVQIICIVLVISSIGLFEANAIQFGMDQLLEASSTQLSQFIPWYFWFMHLGQPIVFFVLLASLLFVSYSLNTHIPL